MKTILSLLAFSASLFAQSYPMTETILAAPLNGIVTNQVQLATLQYAKAPGVQFPQGGIGSPVGVSPNTVMLTWPFSTKGVEAMSIYQVGAAGLTNRVFANRGMYSTYPNSWPAGTLIWNAPASYFANSNPGGACNVTAAGALPRVTIPSGSVWNCVNSRWTFGIEWQQDIGWWQATPAPWNSI